MEMLLRQGENILSEGEESKMLCVSVKSNEETRHWYAFDPRFDDDKPPEVRNMRKYPLHLDKCIGVATAVVDSRYIYLIGGKRIPGYEEMKTVYIFDTVNGKWSKGPSLKKARSFPFVFVIQRKIYVFGTHYVSMNLSVNNWGEYYNLDDNNNQWETISGPDDFKDFLEAKLYAAVVHKDKILFWGNYMGKDTEIFAYNHCSNLWTVISQNGFGQGPKPPSNFMSNHVVIGDFAFWHYYGHLYAWDLTKNTTLRICQLHGVKFADPLDLDDTDKHSPPGPSNLLHAGNGLLCLLRWNMFSGKPKLCCYNFRILGYSSNLSSHYGASHLIIFPCGIKFFDIPGHAIQSAIALSPNMTKRM